MWGRLQRVAHDWRNAVIWSLGGLDVADGDLAGAAVFLSVEGNLLTLVESMHAGALQRRRMDEYVLAAVVRLDEAEALLTVVELYGARGHSICPFTGAGALELKAARCAISSPVVDVWRASERAPGIQRR